MMRLRAEEKKGDREIEEDLYQTQVELAMHEWDKAQPLEIPPKDRKEKDKPRVQSRSSERSILDKPFGSQIRFLIKWAKEAREPKKQGKKTKSKRSTE
jgi:hypothetical protein